MTKEELVAQIQACTACSIGRLGTRTNVVPAQEGATATAPLLALMCEAPGAQEDQTGRPLVGKAGQLLDKMLATAGLDRKNLLLLNRVRCRPPQNNLKAYPDALGKCDSWTAVELEFYNPAVVVLMGATAMKNIFGTDPKVGEWRGTVRKTEADFEFGKRVWVPTYHPASVLRPTGRHNYGVVVADLLLARDLLRSAK